MKKYHISFNWITAIICAGSLTFSLAQETSYLTQKLMVENDLRTRISDALSKVIDESKYVIDVSVDLKITDAVEEQITVTTGDKPSEETQALTTDTVAETKPTIMEDKISDLPKSSMVGLPIPGFEFEVPLKEAPTEEEPLVVDEPTTNIDVEAVEEKEEPSLSKTSILKRPSIAEISRLEISLILNEGAAPELIENIRQIVMMASRFNRTRGDVLSIMTASFKERRDEKTAEQVLLKTIAEKLDNLEKEQTDKVADKEEWQTELDRYREEEQTRRLEDRQYLQNLLTQFEQEEKERAFRKERQKIIKQDSIQIEILKNQIDSLRASLETTPQGEDSEETQTEIEQREALITQIDNQISDRLGSLQEVQEDLDRQLNEGKSNGTLTLVFVLAALLVILLLVVVAMLASRTKQAYPPPPPWMYPPKKKSKKKKTKAKSEKKEPEAATENKPVTKTTIEPTKDEDISVLQSEINDIRKAVVSMSVGQPNTATRIVKEWLEDEAPPVAEEPAPKEEPSDQNKK